MSEPGTPASSPVYLCPSRQFEMELLCGMGDLLW